MRNKLTKVLLAGLTYSALSVSAWAANYVIDDDQKGAHASINFKIQHLGYSWLTGRFNQFDGSFEYDPKQVEQAQITVNIDTTSVDTNHAERDKHLRSDDFLNVAKFPAAKFESTSIKEVADGKLEVKGKFTLNGVTNDLTIMAEKIGEGKDPWGGYRAGFSGTTKFALKDYGIEKNLGPASTQVYLDLHIEGVRK
ncbi:YceI family protein [Catenovulum sp. 2E275]|uniref:YceI family protein n=1 Tax=Catenovulum sp. 2E275 TaxID=2980497 RepID=UPI0021CEDD98|nr:YceI family protein [Catenovulum sp. 2E275]MCU4675503.1 YceI family protein [Catenovulum sp. 2E275]